MSSILRYALYLVLLAGAAFGVYALVAELPPPTRTIVAPAPPPGG
ncbi:MAG: hypothetical protein AAF763_06405 [Pseudomonadota bacterium]